MVKVLGLLCRWRCLPMVAVVVVGMKDSKIDRVVGVCPSLKDEATWYTQKVLLVATNVLQILAITESASNANIIVTSIKDSTLQLESSWCFHPHQWRRAS